MTNTFRMLMLTGALAGAFAVSTGAAAKEITVALASTFTTMDPYDAGDTLRFHRTRPSQCTKGFLVSTRT